MSDAMQAARLIDQAAYNLECSLERQRTFMDDWLQRFQTALDEHAAKIAHPAVVIEPAPVELDPERLRTQQERERRYKTPSPDFPCVDCQATKDPVDYGCGKPSCPHDNIPF